MPTHLDLFSGIGGFSLAAKQIGFDTIQFVEKDKFCKKVLQKHWPLVPIHDDIKTFNFTNKVDLLTGGFPCQPFSNAGNKKGINDDRYLWNEMFRIIGQCNPDWVIAENVAGIVAMELDNIIDDLARMGYETQSFIIPACAANAPHRRDRVWIVANSMQKRCDSGIYYWQSRHIPKDQKWNMEKIHEEWSQFQPNSWKTRKTHDWLAFNTESLRGNYGLPTRLDKDRVKVLGNAIVPQVVFPILKIIHAQILSAAA